MESKQIQVTLNAETLIELTQASYGTTLSAVLQDRLDLLAKYDRLLADIEACQYEYEWALKNDENTEKWKSRF